MCNIYETKPRQLIKVDIVNLQLHPGSIERQANVNEHGLKMPENLFILLNSKTSSSRSTLLFKSYFQSITVMLTNKINYHVYFLFLLLCWWLSFASKSHHKWLLFFNLLCHLLRDTWSDAFIQSWNCVFHIFSNEHNLIYRNDFTVCTYLIKSPFQLLLFSRTKHPSSDRWNSWKGKRKFLWLQPFSYFWYDFKLCQHLNWIICKPFYSWQVWTIGVLWWD